MFITKLALPRRTFLRGMGAAVGLPLLDAMVPALSALGRSAAQPVRRLGFVYLPMGAIKDEWTPAGVGTNFELSPILSAFSQVREQLTVLTGLTHAEAAAMGDGNGSHSRVAAVYLTGVHPRRTEGADIQAGTSVDQLAARQLGQGTQLPSLELAIDSGTLVGNCENGYSCAYLNSLSWRSPTTPNPMETNPRTVFEQMFGEGGSGAQRRVQMREDSSVLDWVNGDLKRLERELGPSDRARVAEYFDAIRAVEQRIQAAEKQGADDPLVLPEAPLGVPNSYEEHVRLLFDMLVLAYRTDTTRVFTFALGRELSNRTYPQIGVPDPHHNLSHHGNDPAKIMKLAKVQTHQAQLTASFLEQLKATEDGDGSLLDHSMILFGSGMSNSNEHSYIDLPLAVLGGGSGQLKGSRHLTYPEDTPAANLFVSLLHKVGCPVEPFGNSTGELADL